MKMMISISKVRTSSLFMYESVLLTLFLVCLPLREHLQTAMEIELATIPLYLFGMYSIKIPAQYVNDPRYYDPDIGAIRGHQVF